MNWKAFWATLVILIGGLAGFFLFSLGLIWVEDTFGIWWIFGGGTLAFIVFIAAIVGMTDRDSPI